MPFVAGFHGLGPSAGRGFDAFRRKSHLRQEPISALARWQTLTHVMSGRWPLSNSDTSGQSARMLLRERTRTDHDRVDAAFARFDLGDPADYREFLLAQASALLPLEHRVRLVAPPTRKPHPCRPRRPRPRHPGTARVARVSLHGRNARRALCGRRFAPRRSDARPARTRASPPPVPVRRGFVTLALARRPDRPRTRRACLPGRGPCRRACGLRPFRSRRSCASRSSRP